MRQRIVRGLLACSLIAAALSSPPGSGAAGDAASTAPARLASAGSARELSGSSSSDSSSSSNSAAPASGGLEKLQLLQHGRMVSDINGGITGVGCGDDPTYFDVWNCAAWAGFACIGMHATPDRSALLVRSCPVSCADVIPVCNPPPYPPGQVKPPASPPPSPRAPGLGVPKLEGTWYAPFRTSPGDG